MDTKYQSVVEYRLECAGAVVELNSLLGKEIKLVFSGKIFCSNCHKQIKKSFSQGFCYPCSIKLAACDLCILKPETCHFDQGTCREPDWGMANCMTPHIVYLANSSGLKVGITRKTNVPFRWMDQGATEALPILEVKNRLTSGKIEVLFKKHVADKTDWRKMLKGDQESVDLILWRDRLLEELKTDLSSFSPLFLNERVMTFNYPVENYPDKIKSLNLEKTPEIVGKLLGIKGQYLILDCGVLNVRSHTGFEVTMEETHVEA